jgi:serine/threonine-protein kinase
MAEVFLAWHKGPSGFRRQVVLKRIHPHLAEDPQFVSMFLNEAHIAADLSHPNIVHIYDLLQEGKEYVIAMEYIHGPTVAVLMREAARKKVGIPFGHIARIVSSVCEALTYAYQQPGPDGKPRLIIHRDVSPSNVMVALDGQVKLVDFGVAKALQSDVMTRVGTIKGKYGYMSPEQVRCEPIDHRSDIFSVGVLLYELTTGRRLFRRDTEFLTLQAVLKHELPNPGEVVEGYPSDLESIVMRALQRDREDRFPTATELAAELNRCAARHGWNSDAASLGQFVREVVGDMARPTTSAADQALWASSSARTPHPDAQGSGSGVPAVDSAADQEEEPGLSTKALAAIVASVIAVSLILWLFVYPMLD